MAVATSVSMYPVVDTSDIMDLRGDIVEETHPIIVDDKIYVAVGKDLKDSRSTLQWAIDNRGGSKIICILHVHQAADKVPFAGILYTQVSAYHKSDKTERQAMLQLLEIYNQICQKAGVSAEVHYIEMDSIKKGIVEFILKNNVKRLVMGAAADKQFSRKMVDLRSKKAIYVRKYAAASCQIQFICKENIIFTRTGKLDGTGDSTSTPSLPPKTNSNSALNSLIPRSVSEGLNTSLHSNSPTQDYHKVMSDNHGSRISSSSLDSSVESTPTSGLILGRISDEWSGFSKKSPSTSSRLSTCSTEMVDDLGSVTYTINEGSETESDYGATPFKEHVQNPSFPSAPERGMNDELYDQLEQAMAEAENSKRDAFEESIRHRKAEKYAIEAKRRVKASENLYAEELRRRREISETLEKTKKEHEDTKKELHEVSENLRMTLEQISSLESQIAEFDHTVQELEQNIFSAVEMKQNHKKEHDDLQLACDDALRLCREI